MRVEEIHFNHDVNSATSDALNIRKNATGISIQAPEWKRGFPAQTSAYAAAALGGQVTIKASFSGGPTDAAREIRAVDAWAPGTIPSGFRGRIASFIARLPRSLPGNVLGDTDEQSVFFDGAGDSGLITFTLVNHQLKTAGVGIRTTEWKWQVREKGSWQDFDTTQHKVYLVVDMPSGPWDQSPVDNNTQLPWTDALDKACLWAMGAKTKDEAAERITIAVNTHPSQSYTGLTIFGSESYHLSSYLKQLDCGLPFQLNCTDCADAVTTLANLLGCDLFEGLFTNITTRKFLTLGGNPADEADWQSTGWRYHEICWLHQMGQNELIYDACVQVDMDDNYDDLVHIARHPVKMRFGMDDRNDYRYRLVAKGLATVWSDPKRRSVD
jgi:hypothetical protein